MLNNFSTCVIHPKRFVVCAVRGAAAAAADDALLLLSHRSNAQFKLFDSGDFLVTSFIFACLSSQLLEQATNVIFRQTWVSFAALSRKQATRNRLTGRGHHILCVHQKTANIQYQSVVGHHANHANIRSTHDQNWFRSLAYRRCCIRKCLWKHS